MIRGLGKSNRPKERANILDDFDHCVIKRTIHGLYSRKIAPTVSIIHKAIKDSIKISKSKLTLYLSLILDILIQNRLYDQVSIINDRCDYLRKIKSFREAGYDIVYMDETWVNQNHCTYYMWLPNDGSDAPKIPSGKGKLLIVFHAGTRSEGLIDGCDLMFLVTSKDGDYHQGMNSVVFWIGNQLMPALKNPSLVVLDNARYPNVKREDTMGPNFNQKKAVLQNYLKQYNIPFSATDTKKVLYKKNKTKKDPH